MAAIRIDPGTTNSCVSTVQGGQAEVIVNSEERRTTPSVVAFSKEGERLVGDVALRQQAVSPERTMSSVKRHMAEA